MPKPAFLKLAIGVVVIFAVAGVGYAGLVMWRERVKLEPPREDQHSEGEATEKSKFAPQRHAPSSPVVVVKDALILLSPSEGDRWVMGNTYEVSWYPDNPSEEVIHIQLINLDAPTSATRLAFDLPESVPNDGEYLVRIPTGIATGDRYRFELTAYVLNQNVIKRGYSATFSISPE